MIDALPAAIYTTDVEGRLTHFNPAAVDFSGRVPELGTDQWCVSWKLFRPEGTPLRHDECPMAVALKEGRIVDGAETIAERPDGNRIWFVPYPRLLRDAEGRTVGGINMLLDITNRKQAERATSLLAAIVDSSEDAIISKSLDGIITSWNEGAVRMFGYTAEEAVGQHITLIIPPHLREEEATILKRLRRGERIEHFETIRMRKNGTVFDISLTISPLKDASGRVVGASKVARDITDRKKSEDALRQSHANLEHMVEQRTSVLRALYSRLLLAQDDERRRVARELHDSVGQYLCNLKINLTRMNDSGQQSSSPQLLSECLMAVDECISETRTISHLLHPPLLDEAGLWSAARWYVDGFAERSGIQTELDFPPWHSCAICR